MSRMRRPSYRQGVEWIALEDNPGGDDALDAGSVCGYISTSLLADLFDVAPSRVAADVVRYRKRERLAEDVMGS